MQAPEHVVIDDYFGTIIIVPYCESNDINLLCAQRLNWVCGLSFQTLNQFYFALNFSYIRILIKGQSRRIMHREKKYGVSIGNQVGKDGRR